MNIPAETLSPVLRQILEAMYFCTPAYQGSARLEGPLLGASVAFSDSTHADSRRRGAITGEVRLVVTEAWATQMSADFLPTHPDRVTREQMEAMVRELANVACGATLSAWLPESDFHFEIPRDLESCSLAQSFEHCFSASLNRPELAVQIILDEVT